jgi:hypothetical protein
VSVGLVGFDVFVLLAVEGDPIAHVRFDTHLRKRKKRKDQLKQLVLPGEPRFGFTNGFLLLSTAISSFSAGEYIASSGDCQPMPAPNISKFKLL